MKHKLFYCLTGRAAVLARLDGAGGAFALIRWTRTPFVGLATLATGAGSVCPFSPTAAFFATAVFAGLARAISTGTLARWAGAPLLVLATIAAGALARITATSLTA